MRERHYRSVVKALSWRLTGTFDTIILCFLISGKFKVAISVGVVELFTKIALYYLHERVWNRISFGRIVEKSPEYSI